MEPLVEARDADLEVQLVAFEGDSLGIETHSAGACGKDVDRGAKVSPEVESYQQRVARGVSSGAKCHSVRYESRSNISHYLGNFVPSLTKRQNETSGKGRHKF